MDTGSVCEVKAKRTSNGTRITSNLILAAVSRLMDPGVAAAGVRPHEKKFAKTVRVSALYCPYTNSSPQYSAAS